MKSKRTTYLLMAVVAGIWGLIGWKVWKGLQGDDDLALPAERVVQSGKKNQLSDSFELIANYRDPFLGRTMQQTSTVAATTVRTTGTAKTTITKPEPPVNTWPEIRYGGFIKKSGQENAAGFLIINGSSEIVTRGQKIQDITIVQLWRDSVAVMRGKERRIIKK
ncbi:MAG: hypothetical protein ACRC3B_12580 [Bacteroidia bacterium]